MHAETRGSIFAVVPDRGDTTGSIRDGSPLTRCTCRRCPSVLFAAVTAVSLGDYWNGPILAIVNGPPLEAWCRFAFYPAK